MAKKQINDQTELPDAEVVAVDTENETVLGTNNDARVAMLERINDINDGVRAEELADVNDDDTTSPFVAAPITEEEVAEVPPVEEVPPTEVEPQQLPLKFKIKVNGKELELTQEQLVERAQKVEAADAYLAEAARLRKEAQNPPLVKQPPTPDAAVQTEDDLRAQVRALQMGTEDEALAVLRSLKSNAPPINPDDIARTVDERLTFKEAARWFQTEYADIMDDPTLRGLALRRDQELLAAGDARTYQDRYTEVGTELRAWRDGIVEKFAPTPLKDDPQATKQRLKAAAPKVPTVAQKKAPSTAVEDEPEESIPQIIANIAKARGGPQWARS